MIDLGKIAIIVGVVLLIVGVLLTFGIKIPYVGRLPGDIYIKRDGFVFYFPITTSIIVTILLGLLLRLFGK